MNKMPNCVSLEKFYRCVKEYMKDYQNTKDTEKIQSAYLQAVEECANIEKGHELGTS